MDLTQYNWNRLPDWKKEQQEAFFEDRKGDASLVLANCEYGAETRYTYYNGARPKPSRSQMWRQRYNESIKKQRHTLTKTAVIRNLRRAALAADAFTAECDGDTANKRSRYYAPRNIAIERDMGMKRLLLQPKKRKRRRFDSLHSPVRGPRDFITVEETESESDSSGSKDKDKDSKWLSYEDRVAKRQAEYLRRTREDPKNLQHWLDYAEFQNKVFMKGTKACFEKKLSIFDRALDHLPECEELWKGMAEAAAAHLAPESVEDVWDSALRRLPGSSSLWLGLIDWKRSVFSDFAVRNFRSLYSKGIRRLLATKHYILEDDDLSEADRKYQLYFIEEGIVRLIAATAALERQCGYIERGIALFQAEIEATVFPPPNLETWREKMDAFEEFWSSEVPRIGEEGAVGWGEWHEARKRGAVPRPPRNAVEKEAMEMLEELERGSEQREGKKEATSKEEAALKGEPTPKVDYDADELNIDALRALIGKVQAMPVYMEWCKLHLARSSEQWAPCRPLRDASVALADPDRVVLLDDIENLMAPVYERGQHHLLFQLFLEFMGVPVLYSQRSIDDPLLNDTLCRYQDGAYLTSVFSCTSWIDKFDWNPTSIPTDPTKVDFIRRILERAIATFPEDPMFPLLRLDIEASLNLDKALEIGKAALESAENSKNIHMWGHYALLLRKAGQYKKAAKVYEVVLTSGLTDPTKKAFFSSIIRQYIELLLLAKAPREDVLHTLCCAAEGAFTKLKKGAAVDTSRVVRAKKSLHDTMETLCAEASGDVPGGVLKLLETAFCSALFQLLTVGDREAWSVFEKALEAAHRMKKSPQTKLQLQYLTLLFAKFVHYPKLLGIRVDPKQVRDILHRAAMAYPTHPVLTSLYVSAEMETGAQHSIRMYFGRALSKSNGSPLVYLYALHVERFILNNQTRVRHLFQAAFDLPNCRGCEMLWLAAMKYENSIVLQSIDDRVELAEKRARLQAALEEGVKVNIRRKMEAEVVQGEKKLSRVKHVFYRAIAEIPGSVQLWVTGIQLLAGAMSPQEVQDTIDVMFEKELHVRAFVEEVAEVDGTTAKALPEPVPERHYPTESEIEERLANARKMEELKRVESRKKREREGRI
eukprot:Sspe_Gene.3205::Locus_1053_Transcript_1_1_Confidence_1.000_Length_3406::g.3205::m.3205